LPFLKQSRKGVALGTVFAGIVAADDPRIVVGIALAAAADTALCPVLLKVG
jgi:hypothetical protein